MFGKVYKAFDHTARVDVALKMISPETRSQPMISSLIDAELRILPSLNHPNIVKLLDQFQVNGDLCLVYSFCEQGDLMNKINENDGLSEKEALIFISHLAHALMYLKDRKIIHRDIKPENIFISNGVPVLGDFGFCIEGPQHTSNNYIGSLAFLSPETLCHKTYDHKTDVYSMGIVFHEMLMGEIPFKDEDVDDIVKIKIELKIKCVPGKNICQDTMILLRDMCSVTTSRRATPEDIYFRARQIIGNLGRIKAQNAQGSGRWSGLKSVKNPILLNSWMWLNTKREFSISKAAKNKSPSQLSSYSRTPPTTHNVSSQQQFFAPVSNFIPAQSQGSI